MSAVQKRELSSVKYKSTRTQKRTGRPAQGAAFYLVRLWPPEVEHSLHSCVFVCATSSYTKERAAIGSRPNARQARCVYPNRPTDQPTRLVHLDKRPRPSCSSPRSLHHRTSIGLFRAARYYVARPATHYATDSTTQGNAMATAMAVAATAMDENGTGIVLAASLRQARRPSFSLWLFEYAPPCRASLLLLLSSLLSNTMQTDGTRHRNKAEQSNATQLTSQLD